MSISLEMLAKDIKECCNSIYYGNCHKCPYRYVSLHVCRLQYVDTDEMEALHKISDFRGNLCEQKVVVNRNFEADLYEIKKRIDELCERVDVISKGGKNEQSS